MSTMSMVRCKTIQEILENQHKNTIPCFTVKEQQPIYGNYELTLHYQLFFSAAPRWSESNQILFVIKRVDENHDNMKNQRMRSNMK